MNRGPPEEYCRGPAWRRASLATSRSKEVRTQEIQKERRAPVSVPGRVSEDQIALLCREMKPSEVEAPPLRKAYVNFMRGHEKSLEGELVTAVEFYTDAARLDPLFIGALFNRGVVLCSMNRTREGVEDFSRCIEVDGNNTTALFNRASCYLSLGMPDKALVDLDRIAELPSVTASLIDQAELYMLRALADRRTGGFARCADNYKTAYLLQGKPIPSISAGKRRWQMAVGQLNRKDALALSFKGRSRVQLPQSLFARFKAENTKSSLSSSMAARFASIVEQRTKLRAALLKPGEERNENDIRVLLDAMQGIEFVRTHPQPDLLIDLARRVTFLSLPAREIIFEEDDAANTVYMIFSGCVHLFMASTGTGDYGVSKESDGESIKVDKKGRKRELVDILRPGQCFGTVASRDGGKIGRREETAVTFEPSEFLCIAAEDYFWSVRVLRDKEIAEIEQFLRTVRVFDRTVRTDLHRIASIAVVRSFTNNTKVIDISDPVDNFYICQSGMFKMFKSVTLHNHPPPPRVASAISPRRPNTHRPHTAPAYRRPSPHSRPHHTSSNTAQSNTPSPLPESDPFHTPSVIPPQPTPSPPKHPPGLTITLPDHTRPPSAPQSRTTPEVMELNPHPSPSATLSPRSPSTHHRHVKDPAPRSPSSTNPTSSLYPRSPSTHNHSHHHQHTKHIHTPRSPRTNNSPPSPLKSPCVAGEVSLSGTSHITDWMTIHSGDFFAEEAIHWGSPPSPTNGGGTKRLTNSPEESEKRHRIRVVCSSKAGTLIAIPIAYRFLFGEETRILAAKLVATRPSEESLRVRLREQIRWASYRKKVVDDIEKDVRHTKNAGNYTFR